MVKKYKNMKHFVVLSTLLLDLVQCSFVQASAGKVTPFAKQQLMDARMFEKALQSFEGDFLKLKQSLALKISTHTIEQDDILQVDELIKNVKALKTKAESAGVFIKDEDLESDIDDLIKRLNNFNQIIKPAKSAEKKVGKLAVDQESPLAKMLRERQEASNRSGTVQPGAKKAPVVPSTATAAAAASSSYFDELKKSIEKLQDEETDKFNDMTKKLIQYRKDQQKDASAILSEYAVMVQHILASLAKGTITEKDAQQLIVQYQKNFEELQKILIGMFV